MNNQNEMLVLAEMMGLEVHVVGGGKIYDFTNDVYFNPSTDEILEWLLTLGYFEIVTQNSVEFTPLTGLRVFTSLNDNLKQNILNIALQVSKYLKEAE